MRLQDFNVSFDTKSGTTRLVMRAKSHPEVLRDVKERFPHATNILAKHKCWVNGPL